jgi:hypothetical protein
MVVGVGREGEGASVEVTAKVAVGTRVAVTISVAVGVGVCCETVTVDGGVCGSVTEMLRNRTGHYPLGVSHNQAPKTLHTLSMFHEHAGIVSTPNYLSRG